MIYPKAYRPNMVNGKPYWCRWLHTRNWQIMEACGKHPHLFLNDGMLNHEPSKFSEYRGPIEDPSDGDQCTHENRKPMRDRPFPTFSWQCDCGAAG